MASSMSSPIKPAFSISLARARMSSVIAPIFMMPLSDFMTSVLFPMAPATYRTRDELISSFLLRIPMRPECTFSIDAWVAIWFCMVLMLAFAKYIFSFAFRD